MISDDLENNVETDSTETTVEIIKSTGDILKELRNSAITEDGNPESVKSEAKPAPQGTKNTSNLQSKEISAERDDDTVSLSRAELAKREKSNEETKQWGTELSRKLKSFESKLARYVDDGILTDDELEDLKKDIQHEQRDQGEEPPLMKYVKVWDTEIENLRKYTDDPNLDKKIHAFQHFLGNSSPEEINETMESFKELEGDSVALTKKMLAVGSKYNEEIFSELYEAGNLKNFKKKYQSDLENKQKEIDKLNKEVLRYKLEYEDYQPSATMKLPVGTTDKFPEQPKKARSTSEILEDSRRERR